MKTIDRFWNRVNKNGVTIPGMESKCWEWITKSKNSRPQINIGKGKIISAHKFIWQFFNGKVPDGKYVIKRCNNPQCVNYHHMVLGTLSDLRMKLIITKDGIKLKPCSRCGNVYPFTSEHFHADSSHVTGLHGRCKSCSADVNRETNVRKWERYLINQSKTSSEKRGYDFSLTEQDVRDLFDNQEGRCYWFGVLMEMSIEPRDPFKPSIDRLDRNKGYTKENVVLCCQLANIGRNAGEVSSFLDFLGVLPESLPKAMWKENREWQRN